MASPTPRLMTELQGQQAGGSVVLDDQVKVNAPSVDFQALQSNEDSRDDKINYDRLEDSQVGHATAFAQIQGSTEGGQSNQLNKEAIIQENPSNRSEQTLKTNVAPNAKHGIQNR